MKTLYGKSSAGKLLLWQIYTEGNTYTVRHGVLGGKIQTKTTNCIGKNIGKSNETTPEQQAIVEADAKYELQKKKGYYETKEEALEHVEFTPMKLNKWTEQSHKITYPCYVQPKLDGQRYMVQKNGKGLSKQGENISLPEHIQKDVDVLANTLGKRFKGLDGEVYAGLMSKGGLSLQRIISAFRKANDDTPLLKYFIYDIPDSTEPFNQRVESLHEINEIVKQHDLQNIVVVTSSFMGSKKAVEELYEEHISEGFEGSVVRNQRGMYEFGKRSYDAQKIKKRDTMEAYVVSAQPDKNQQALLGCELENGVQFKCLMRKDADANVNLRLYENHEVLIGKWIEVEYEALSDDGVPAKPVGLRIRNVNPVTFEGE